MTPNDVKMILKKQDIKWYQIFKVKFRMMSKRIFKKEQNRLKKKLKCN